MTRRSDVLREVMPETCTTQGGNAVAPVRVHQPSTSGFLSGRVDLSDEMLDGLLSLHGLQLAVARRPSVPGDPRHLQILGTYSEDQLFETTTMSIAVDVLPIAESNEETHGWPTRSRWSRRRVVAITRDGVAPARRAFAPECLDGRASSAGLSSYCSFRLRNSIADSIFWPRLRAQTLTDTVLTPTRPE